MCSDIGGGSGPSYLTGWITTFVTAANFGTNIYKRKIDTKDVESSNIEVPVLIDDNGTEIKTIFYGGHIQNLYDPADSSIRPSLDWVLIDVTKSKEIQQKRRF